MGKVARLFFSMITMNVCLLGFGFESLAHTKIPDGATPAEDVCEGQLTGKALLEAQQKWAGKTVIFDTNVILNDPQSIRKYPGAEIVIPITVIEELDGKKEDHSTGKAARDFSRLVERLTRVGDISEGVSLSLIDPVKSEGPSARLRVDMKDYVEVLKGSNFDPSKNDNKIIATAKAYAINKNPGDVVLVSDDINVRIKAASLKVLAMPFEYEWISAVRSEDKGYKDLVVTEVELKRFLAEGSLPKPGGLKIAPNEFVMIRTEGGHPGPDNLARYVYDREDPAQTGLRKLRDFSDLPFQPKNIEQAMFLDLLLDPMVQLVIVDSEAGTGKSFLALMAGVLQIKRGDVPGEYESMMITRLMVQIGKEILGALPGDKDAKLKEHYAAFYDNLKVILAKEDERLKEEAAVAASQLPATVEEAPVDPNVRMSRRQKKMAHRAEVEKRAQARAANKGGRSRDNGKIEIPGLELLPFSHVRGRSLHNTFLVGDEIQNTSVGEIKALLTRIGVGSKIILLGDVSQIDPPYLHELNNGLSVAKSLYTASDLTEEERSRAAAITLKESVREPFTELSIKVFKKQHSVGKD